jgi:hypothetical protein
VHAEPGAASELLEEAAEELEAIGLEVPRC